MLAIGLNVTKMSVETGEILSLAYLLTEVLPRQSARKLAESKLKNSTIKVNITVYYMCEPSGHLPEELKLTKSRNLVFMLSVTRTIR